VTTRVGAYIALGFLVACARPPVVPEVTETAPAPSEVEGLPLRSVETVGLSSRRSSPSRLAGVHPLELARTYELPWDRVPRLEAHPSVVEGALVLQEDGFVSATGPTHPLMLPTDARPPTCAYAESAFARWESLPKRMESSATLRYGRFEGMSAGCRVKARRSYEAELPALVPGLLYVFRTCDGVGCDSGARAPGSLVLVSPGPAFVASFGRARGPTEGARGGSFARTEVPLATGRDGAAVATLNLTGEAILAWRQLFGLPRPKPRELELSESRLLSIRIEATTLAGETDLRAFVRVNGSAGRQLVAWLESAPSSVAKE
jgi:hypothetical protein